MLEAERHDPERVKRWVLVAGAETQLDLRRSGRRRLQAALEALVDPLTRGDPTSPLRWTCKSRAKPAAALTEQGEADPPSNWW